AGLGVITSGCIAATTFLFGTVVNQVYVNRNFPAVVMISIAAIVLFTAKGLSMYFSSIILARASNRMAADLQRQAFDKLLFHGLTYFSKKHSSEFLHRVTRGSAGAVKSLTTIVNAGRDLLTLIFLVAVMVYREPILSIIGMISMPVAMLFIRGLVRRTRELANRELKDTRYILETLHE